MLHLDWLNSRGFDFPRECGKNDPFSAGNAGKDSSVKVPNFLAKSKWYLVKIFEKNGKLFQMHIVIKILVGSISTINHTLKKYNF